MYTTIPFALHTAPSWRAPFGRSEKLFLLLYLVLSILLSSSYPIPNLERSFDCSRILGRSEHRRLTRWIYCDFHSIGANPITSRRLPTSSDMDANARSVHSQYLSRFYAVLRYFDSFLSTPSLPQSHNRSEATLPEVRASNSASCSTPPPTRSTLPPYSIWPDSSDLPDVPLDAVLMCRRSMFDVVSPFWLCFLLRGCDD